MKRLEERPTDGSPWYFRGHVLTSTAVPTTDREIDLNEPSSQPGWAHYLDSTHAIVDGAIPVIVAVWATYTTTNQQKQQKIEQGDAQNSGDTTP